MANRKNRDSGKKAANSNSNMNSPRAELERKRVYKKKKKREQDIKRAILAFIILIVLLIGFGAIYLFSFISGLNTENLSGGYAPDKNQPLNILILGMDIGDAEQSENEAIRRTDTMMVFNYNPNTDKVNIVSIPRDTLIEVDDAYDAYGNSIPYWKMNAAYALGGEDEVIKQVQNLLEVDINYIVEINYQAFRSIIDAIGGIEMEIPFDMKYDDDGQDLHIDFKGGETVLLDGKKAEEFIRWRKNNDGTGFINGDLGRIENQQKFISKVINKVTSPSIIFDIPDILKAIEQNVVTNMSGGKIVSYALKAVKNSGVTMSTLQGYDEIIYEQSFLIVEKEANQDIINSLKTGTAPSISRSNYNILLLNGTGINGLAGNYKADLMNIGYSNIEVGNAEETEKSIILCNDSELSDLLESDLGIKKIKTAANEEYADYDAVIILGSNYDQ